MPVSKPCLSPGTAFASAESVRRIDGFFEASTQPYVGYEPRTADLFWEAISDVSRRLHVEVSGIERLPLGRALLVMNHAFGWDATLPMAAIRRATGRRVWALGEHLWWRFPFVRRLAAAVGAVDGTPDNADCLLRDDELLLVLPGGLREAMKPPEMRYRLLWGQRYGFVRSAIRCHAPLVPVAGIGADEVFDLVGDAYARGRRWLHRDDVPIPRLRARVHHPHLSYVIGEPIEAAILPGETEEMATHRIRREVRGALEELIDDGLARRLGLRSSSS